MTCFSFQCGNDIVSATPMLVALQNRIVELPQVRSFIRSSSYYPLGGEEYVKQVQYLIYMSPRIMHYVLYCFCLFWFNLVCFLSL